MGGLDPRTPVAEVDRITHELRKLKDRIDELTSPSGTMAYQAVTKLQALVTDIQAQLDDYIANDAYTKAQVDAKIASPGAISPSSVSASGSVVGAAARFDGGLASQDVYDRIVSGAGYRATWTASDGQIGYVPSSRRFKTEIRPADFSLAQVLKLQAVYYHYLARPPYSPESTPLELGLIAEEVHDLGFTNLVDYDDDGKPFGVRYDLVSLIVLEGMRDLVGRVELLEQQGGAS